MDVLHGSLRGPLRWDACMFFRLMARLTVAHEDLSNGIDYARATPNADQRDGGGPRRRPMALLEIQLSACDGIFSTTSIP